MDWGDMISTWAFGRDSVGRLGGVAIVLPVLLLTACATSTQTQDLSTPTPTGLAALVTATSAPTRPATSTFTPTLTDPGIVAFEPWGEFMKRSIVHCDRPCWLGIVPGESTRQQVTDLYRPVTLGRIPARSVEFTIQGTDELSGLMATFFVERPAEPESTVLGLVVLGYDVQRQPELSQALAPYSAPALVRWLGKPSRIYFGINPPIESLLLRSYDLLLYYDEFDLKVNYSGSVRHVEDKDVRVCVTENDVDYFEFSQGAGYSEDSDIDALGSLVGDPPAFLEAPVEWMALYPFARLQTLFGDQTGEPCAWFTDD